MSEEDQKEYMSEAKGFDPKQILIDGIKEIADKVRALGVLAGGAVSGEAASLARHIENEAEGLAERIGFYSSDHEVNPSAISVSIGDSDPNHHAELVKSVEPLQQAADKLTEGSV